MLKLYTTKRFLAYSQDGINSKNYESGDPIEVHEAHAPGLLTAGLIGEIDSMPQKETKDINGAPETGKPTTFDSPKIGGGGEGGPIVIVNGAALEAGGSNPDFDRGFAMQQSNGTPERIDMDNQKFQDGWHAGELADRSKVKIDDGWVDLGWPQLRALATQVSDDSVNNKDQAVAAINAELARRAKAKQGE